MASNWERAVGGEDPVASPSVAGKKPSSRWRQISAWTAVLGMVAVSYVLGAAVMFFRLPTSDFFSKAFLGAKAWQERQAVPTKVSDEELLPATGDNIDKPGKTFDGYTLFTRASTSFRFNTEVFLANMRRQVVHTWAVSFSEIWPHPDHIDSAVNDSEVCIFSCHLFPNGDLLVVFHGLNRNTNGYGLAKLDKDSNLIWKYSANVHHDVDVGEDGTIYAIKQENVREGPKELAAIPPPWLIDYLVMLSPDGREIRKPLPILDALCNSQYAPLMAPVERPIEASAEGLTKPLAEKIYERQDILHSNSVQVLPHRLAPKFSKFRAGQVLVSFRNLDAVAVLDTEKDAVVWATTGPWRAQHDLQFLDNGHLLIFDNLGSPKGSRVLEYDPQTQAFPWSYAGENWGPFFTNSRGMSQRLPNGNTLIVNSEKGEILEVTHAKEVVWSCHVNGYVPTARRYGAGQLHFLTENQHARP